MIGKILLNAIEKILEVSRKNRIPLMFMGGIAASAWGNPRATYDISGRTKDLEDIRNILVMQKGKLYKTYMRKWAKQLGISAFLKDELNSAYGKEKISRGISPYLTCL